MRSQDEIVKDIKTVLEEKVAPSVAAHNGSINFIDFASDTGVARDHVQAVPCLKLLCSVVLRLL